MFQPETVIRGTYFSYSMLNVKIAWIDFTAFIYNMPVLTKTFQGETVIRGTLSEVHF